MRKWARVFAPFLLLLLTAAAAPEHPDARILLVKGRIEAAEYIGSLMPEAPPSNEPFIDGGDYRVRLVVDDVLIGHAHEPDLYLTLTITDAPPGDAHPEIFLLAKKDSGGQFEPIAWDYASDGVCIDADTAETYGITGALPEIEKKYPCKSMF